MFAPPCYCSRVTEPLPAPSTAFFGLLYLDQQHVGAANAALRSYDEQRLVYLKNAALLADSLRRIGHSFILLTNGAEELRELDGNHLGADLDIQEIPFQTPVPQGIRFYSAHFKLDVFRYFSTSPLSYVVLLDLDMVALRAFNASFTQAAEEGIPLAYDITDQVGGPAYMHDVRRLEPSLTLTPWFGGEFLAGPPTFFQRLSAKVDHYFPTYVRHVAEFQHQGDETLTTTALGTLIREGLTVENAGKLGLVTRYWSVHPNHRQPSARERSQVSLWHLPSDKSFLAQTSLPFEPADFKRRYAAHLRRQWPRNVAKALLKAVRRA